MRANPFRPELKLFSHEPAPDLTDEQRERMLIILNMVVSLFERAYLIRQLKHLGGSVGKLAKVAGMERTHLYRKLRALGIDAKQVANEQ